MSILCVGHCVSPPNTTPSHIRFTPHAVNPRGLQIKFPINPSGYTAKEVKALLARVGAGKGEGEGSRKLKRVVMLSSVGVNRRDDMMLKLRQMHVNLDERVRFWGLGGGVVVVG